MSDQRTSRKAWVMVALLFGFMMINFADKVIVGLAGVPIMTDLQLTPKQFGLVGSSFFLLFSISAVIMGASFGSRSCISLALKARAEDFKKDPKKA